MFSAISKINKGDVDTNAPKTMGLKFLHQGNLILIILILIDCNDLKIK